jgi:hypothetical protein
MQSIAFTSFIFELATCYIINSSQTEGNGKLKKRVFDRAAELCKQLVKNSKLNAEIYTEIQIKNMMMFVFETSV